MNEFMVDAGFACGSIEVGLETWGDLEKPKTGAPFDRNQLAQVLWG